MKGNEFEYLLDNLSLSTLLAKSSFAFLLLSMLFYWFQTSFKSDRLNKTFLGKTPSLTMWLANIALALMLSIRWVESGHFPLSNLYESLLFLSWSLTAIHFFLERAFYQGGIISPTLGAITAPLALFTNAFATFSLPQEMQKITVLVPALQSNWLIMHVSVMMVSYAALLSGSLLAMAFLVVKFVEDTLYSNRSEINNTSDQLVDQKENVGFFESNGSKDYGIFDFPLDLNKLPPTGAGSHDKGGLQTRSFSTSFTYHPSVCSAELKGANAPLGGNGGIEQTFQKKLKQTLDNLSYRSIGLGFALLTIGIFSGAVWANEAWGSYWSWDPKETWAFVTWLVFALYLHTRLSRGWVGRESAVVATFGFLVIWFCYLGVNLFGKGLHSYGWFPVK